MTPGARVAAAIVVLDQIDAGAAAEQALTTWARGSRFAGSKDRAAVRDHVYDVLRRRGSLQAMAGDSTGRALMIALLKAENIDPATIFTGDGYAPSRLTIEEVAPNRPISDVWDQVDIPAWLWPAWTESLGPEATAAAIAQQSRAPLYLRVNTRACTVSEAVAVLGDTGILTAPHDHIVGCLRVLSGERQLKSAQPYLQGWVEVQDAASQAAMLRIPVSAGATVLDYCAGGGGKALAIAARQDCKVTAHDIAFARMQDIAPRADRAGVAIQTVATRDLDSGSQFDLVLCDAPCTGSGTWRRTPDAKWLLSADKLLQYSALQTEVLSKSARFVRSGGTLAYMTCSVLRSENQDVINGFLAANQGWGETDEMVLLPSDQSDGFFMSLLRKS